MLCGNITVSGAHGVKVIHHQMLHVLPYRMSDKGGFVFISYILMAVFHFKLKYMTNNKYFGEYFIF